jgi:hypothetical protein
VRVAYAGAWLLSIVAALLALFGDGGLKIAVLAIVPIVLLAPPALLGVRALLGRPKPDGSSTSAAGGSTPYPEAVEKSA